MTDAPNHAEGQSAPPVGFLIDRLGDPSYFGSSSWIQTFYLIGGAVAAVVAVIALRQSAKLSRGTFFFTLFEHWNSMANTRREFSKQYSAIDARIREKFPHDSDEEKDKRIQKECEKLLEPFLPQNENKNDKKEENDNKNKMSNDDYRRLIEYFSFIESLGLYVRKRFIPFGPIYSLYKQAILASGNMFVGHTEQMQKHPGRPPGLFRNALYLVQRTRRRERVRKIIPNRFRKE